MRTASELLFAAYERLQEHCADRNDTNDVLIEEIGRFFTPPIKQIKDPYTEFYDLPEKDRIALIGTILEEQYGGRLYFPIGLAYDEFNYEQNQGLIFVNKPCMDDYGVWFRVGAFSPDDLDKDLDFFGNEVDYYDQVVTFLKRMHKFDVTYYGVLGAI